MNRLAVFAIRGLAVIGLAAIVAVAWFVLSGSRDDLDDTTVEIPSATLEVVVRDISETRTVDLQASTDDPRPVYFPGSGRVSELLLIDDGLTSDTVWARVDGRVRIMGVFETNASFFRDLEQGLRGPDVVLLQEFLNARGAELDDDGFFGRAERLALTEYFELVTGDDHDGKLLLGDLVFVPPGLHLASIEVMAGSVVGDGVPIVMLESGALRYSFRMASSEGNDIPIGAVVEGAEFAGTVTSREVVVALSEDGTTRQELVFAVDGSATRDVLPGESMRVSVVVVQSASTVAVPLNAVSIGTDGSSTVVTATGDELVVTTGRSSDGWVEIVDGVEAGQLIVVPHPDAIASDA